MNILDDQVYESVHFSKARYMNGVGFEILAQSPIPQLPPSYPHPPTHPESKSNHFQSYIYIYIYIHEGESISNQPNISG